MVVGPSWAHLFDYQLRLLGVDDESQGFGKESLPQLQNYQAQRFCAGNLQG
jgi:hypothetical protein